MPAVNNDDLLTGIRREYWKDEKQFNRHSDEAVPVKGIATAKVYR